MARVRVTPEEFQEKHARRVKAALDDMRRGVQRVTEAPGKKAAAKKEKMRTKILEAIDSGKWEERVASVTLEEWQRAMVEKGVARVPQGIDGAADKIRAFAEQLLAHQERVLAEIEQMPDLTLEDSIARATHWIRKMSEFKFKR